MKAKKIPEKKKHPEALVFLTYTIRPKCWNCLDSFRVDIPKGVLVSFYFADKLTNCKTCGASFQGVQIVGVEHFFKPANLPF